jgi:MFS family permease
VSAVLLLRLRPRTVDRAAEELPPPLLAALREGWQEVRRRRWVMAGLGAMASYHAIVLPAVFVLGPITVAAAHGGAKAWAALVVAFGIGSVVGDLVLLRVRPRFALRAAGAGLIVASTQAAIYGSDVSLALMLPLQALAGVGVSAFFTLWEVSLQEHVPGRALSRVSSFDYLAASALMPISTVLVGPLATAVGAKAALLGMSAIGILCAIAFACVGEVRRLPRNPVRAP